MSVVLKENPANSAMHNKPYTVGIISVPDSHYKPVLYSHYQATKDFNQINKDIVQLSAKNQAIDRKKTPAIIIILGVAGGIFGLFKLIGHLLKK